MYKSNSDIEEVISGENAMRVNKIDKFEQRSGHDTSNQDKPELSSYDIDIGLELPDPEKRAKRPDISQTTINQLILEKIITMM